jgi:hypothetical protein
MIAPPSPPVYPIIERMESCDNYPDTGGKSYKADANKK